VRTRRVVGGEGSTVGLVGPFVVGSVVAGAVLEEAVDDPVS